MLILLYYLSSFLLHQVEFHVILTLRKYEKLNCMNKFATGLSVQSNIYIAQQSILLNPLVQGLSQQGVWASFGHPNL